MTRRLPRRRVAFPGLAAVLTPVWGALAIWLGERRRGDERGGEGEAGGERRKLAGKEGSEGHGCENPEADFAFKVPLLERHKGYYINA
jgi:hypothetical protein